MELQGKRLVVKTTDQGVELTVSRRVGPDVKVNLDGQEGPALLTALLNALEPHFPNNDGKTPIPVVLTSKGFAWQAGVSSDHSRDVYLTLRPQTTPGILFMIEPDRAREIGNALIKLAEAADTPQSKN